MDLKKIIGVLSLILMVGVAPIATAGIPDMDLSTASRAYDGPEVAVMYNLPNGGGSPFETAGWIFVGSTVDATIELNLVDGDNVPIFGYPLEDLWLESDDGGIGMIPCIGGSTADANTDALGQTTWVNPLRAGGSSQGLTVVMVSGSPLTSGPGLLISHNSPDLNGDGYVNLPDVAFFASDYYGGLNPFRSDFQYDGMVNLADVSKMAQAVGASCP
jgi:hypothetical protein